MTPYYQKNGVTLYCGDLRDVLPSLPECSVDSVVTDPPYGLSFMDSDWDHEVPGPPYWMEIARVCKPGASMLTFGGTRTYHRLASAIEDAGWEIRDCLMWLYGQGMPKCGDIGKLIDKAKGAERQVVGSKLGRPGYHLHEGKGNGCYGGGDGLHAPGTDARLRASQITAPATPLAERFTGWAMALKPAWEPITLAMKPLDGTAANNAERWGVAGLNIEACRAEAGRWPANCLLQHHPGCRQVGTTTLCGDQRVGCSGCRPGGFGDVGADSGSGGPNGRVYGNETLPSYDCHPDCPVGTLENQKPQVSRFFYCGKARRGERGPGNDHPTVKPVELMNYLLTLCSTPGGGVVLDPFAGSGTTLLAARDLGRECIGVELSPHNCDIIVSRLES